MKTRPRRFPTDAQVDAWISAHFATDDPTDPAGWEQKKAATRDNTSVFANMAMHGVASGNLISATIDRTTSDPADELQRRTLRGTIRTYMAAESAGITRMCPHTRQTRPLILHCDPPVAVCRDCHPKVAPAIQALGFQWDRICDRCGRRSERLHFSGFTLAHMTVMSHICPRCHTEDQAVSLVTADEVIVVGRNRPCPCGSGSKYKRCHGRPAGARS